MELDFRISINGLKYKADLASPFDIALPLEAGSTSVRAFWAPPLEIEPVRMGAFIGSTLEGGAVNFKNVKLNPHGNGTHTECVGHIAKAPISINKCLTNFHFPAKLVSMLPQKAVNGDRVITRKEMENILEPNEVKALIIRTLPNDDLKIRTNYSGANPPYLTAETVQFLVECGIDHLLLDLPSVDREEDGGKLAAHKAFWCYPDNIRYQATITELIYVPSTVPDGYYLLNLQIIGLEMDASPSKPVLYALNAV